MPSQRACLAPRSRPGIDTEEGRIGPETSGEIVGLQSEIGQTVFVLPITAVWPRGDEDLDPVRGGGAEIQAEMPVHRGDGADWVGNEPLIADMKDPVGRNSADTARLRDARRAVHPSVGNLPANCEPVDGAGEGTRRISRPRCDGGENVQRVAVHEHEARIGIDVPSPECEHMIGAFRHPFPRAELALEML